MDEISPQQFTELLAENIGSRMKKSRAWLFLN
jgi:hypothetical protein